MEQQVTSVFKDNQFDCSTYRFIMNSCVPFYFRLSHDNTMMVFLPKLLSPGKINVAQYMELNINYMLMQQAKTIGIKYVDLNAEDLFLISWRNAIIVDKFCGSYLPCNVNFS